MLLCQESIALLVSNISDCSFRILLTVFLIWAENSTSLKMVSLFSLLFDVNFCREKCFLPLKLALESRVSKLANHALTGFHVCIIVW